MDVYVQLRKLLRTKHWFDLSLGVYAKVNGMGFIEAYLRKVTNGTVDLGITPGLQRRRRRGRDDCSGKLQMDTTGKITAEHVIARQKVFLLNQQSELHRCCAKPDCFYLSVFDSFRWNGDAV
jgi:hypothetical protein